MADSPTIVSASLDDKELKASIDKMVSNFNEGLDTMKKSATEAVSDIQRTLQKLGDIKVDSGGSADGGSSKRAKAQNKETEAVKATTTALKEKNATLDQTAQAMQRASGSTQKLDIAQTMRIQLDLMLEKLREARSQYSSFVAMAAKATTTGDKGLFQFATEGVHRYEQEVKNLIPQIRTLREGVAQIGSVMAPQGHTIQNFVQSLQKANPELALLNQQYKEGNSLLSQQVVTASKYTEEIHKQAEAIRNSKEWQEKGRLTVGDTVYYDPERSRDKKMLLSLEEQILQKENERIAAQQKQNQESQKEVEIKTQLPKQGYLFDNVGRGANSSDRKLQEQQIERIKQLKIEEQQVNSMNAAIMRSLSISQEEIKNYDIRTASAKHLNAMLKQQQAAYAGLSMTQRFQKGGTELADSIQRITRALQKLQAYESRPINISVAMKLPTNTLDDIAYKIRQLQAYKMGINLTSPQAASEIKQVDTAIKELKKDMDKYMITSREVNNMNNALARSFNYMKNRLAFYFTVGASQQFVKTLIEIRSQYEMNERALGILINSAEKGSKVFQELSNMALVSPYTLIELSTAAKQLTAYDIAARDVVDTTRRLADMAAAVGIPIERLTYALGQIKAYGYLNARDARMFSNAGIPLVKQLSEYYSELEGKLVSTADIYDRIKKKAIGYNEVMQVVGKMTDEGGKFFDFQAKMAGTLKVQLANLTLAWNNMLNDIGKSEQGMISGTLGLLKNAFLQWKNLNRIIEDLAITFGVLKTAHLVYYGVVLGTNKAIAAQAVLGTRLTGILKLLGSTMNQILTSGTTWWGLLAMAVSGAVISIVRGNEAMKEFNKSLRDDAKTTYEDLEKFSGQYSDLRKSLYKDGMPQDIDKNEAKKAWEVIREQIELSSNASSVFVGKLMNIENVSERLRQGFKIIDDIQAVAAAVKELGDNGIKLEKDWSEWWNLWTFPDGTIENLKDAHTWLSKINEEFGDLKSAKALSNLDVLTTEDGRTVKNLFKSRAEGYIENYENELEKFRKDLSITTRSVIDFIELKGWSNDTTKIEETFSRIFQKLALSNNLSPKEAMTLRLESANAEYKALENALITHLNDESAAFDKARSENEKEEIKSRWNVYKSELNFLRSNTAQSRIYWEDFTKWMGEQHKSEVQAMFKEQSAEQIKMLDFSRGEYNKWATDLAKKYAKEHGMSYKEVYDQLHNYILNANQWSIRIPLIISTEDTKSEVQTLKDADTAVDTAAANIERLKKRQKELEKGGATRVKSIKDQTKADKELLKVDEEIASNEKDLAAARAKGGHGKKEDAKARKAQAAAEKEVTEALKNELSILKEMQSNYDKMRKAGVDNTTAIDLASQGYEDTLKRVNRTLAKHGISQFNAKDFLGKDVNAVLRKLEQQRSDALASGKLKTGTLEALDVEIQRVRVEAKLYNMDKITKGLNNELGKLKEEYELAVELDANPELGGMFADYFGINLEELPKDYEQALKLAQKRINTMLKNSPDVGIASIDIEKLMSRSEFDAWVSSLGKDADSELIKGISDVRSFLYKVRSDETKKQIQEWDKMLEKYAEYEFKRKQITEEYEKDMELARKRGASQSVMDAITNRRDRRYAELDFNEFMRTPDWIVATGDLAGLTDNALGMLIERIEEYKRTASKLEPKQIKQINKALIALYKEQRKGNPFKLISTAMKEAKNRTVEYDEAINDTEREIQGLGEQIESAIEKGESTSELFSKLDSAKKRLEDLKKKQKEVGKLDFKDVVSGLQAIGAMAKTVGDEFAGIFESLGDKGTAETIKGITGTLDKTLSLAAAGSVFGPWGAAIGGALGLASSLFSIFAGKDSIQSAIEDSERAVKRLENAYKELEYAAENAFGAATSGAQEAIKANKELQLAELKRQLALEQSRDGKDRDEDRIIEIRGQIIDLENEIKDFTKDAVNDLLGISSHGDFFESMISEMIEAFKNGEDAMDVFEEKWSDMIDNMIMKTIVSQVLSQWVKTLERGANDILEKYTEDASKKMADLSSHITNLRTMDAGDVSKWIYDNDRETFNKILESMGIASVGDMIGAERQIWFYKAWGSGLAQKIMDAYLSMLDNNMAGLQDELDKKSLDATGELIDYYGEAGKEFKENYLNQILDKIQENWNFGQDSEKQLSSLQQGIQGVTEDTAGAIEAYMNGMSQQVYLQSDILTQIRDAVVSFDMDVHTAVISQILLQLQNTYQLQMSMHALMEGWTTPAGNGIRVELIS